MDFKSLFTMLICVTFINIGYGQVSKTLHQTFTIDGAEKVNVNVVGTNVELKETKGSRILVEVKVTVSSLPNPKILDFIANNGRYDLVKTLDASTRELVLESKKTNDVLIVKGQECQEELEYVIYLPAAVKFANNSTVYSKE